MVDQNKDTINNYHLGDFSTIGRLLGNTKADMLFCDPPYYLRADNSHVVRPEGTDYAAPDEDWDKFISLAKYTEFTYDWLKESFDVLKPTGTLWAMGNFTNIGVILDVLQEDFQANILSMITWHKTNATPNFKGARLKNDAEYLVWVQRKPGKFTFNYNHLKQLNGGTQMGCVWSLPICSGDERLTDEYGFKIHSTQKPEELLKRVILASTKPDDLVVDMMGGTGTCSAVAIKYGRRFIGLDNDYDYVKYACERLCKVTPLPSDTWAHAQDIKNRLPKVPFKALLSACLLQKGEYLYSKNNAYRALILDSGRLEIVGQLGNFSIHTAASVITGKPTNGWEYWYTANGYSIDNLRDIFRKNMEDLE